MSQLTYSNSPAPPEALEAPAAAAQLLDYPSSRLPPPPPGPPGRLSYHSTAVPEPPFVDPGNNPVAIKHELLRMLGDESGVAMLKEAIDRDPAHASVWLERCGLADHPGLQRMVALSKMYM